MERDGGEGEVGVGEMCLKWGGRGRRGVVVDIEIALFWRMTEIEMIARRLGAKVGLSGCALHRRLG